MKISIEQNGPNTRVVVNGVDISPFISEFTLSQKAGEIPVLKVSYIASDGVEAKLPEGVVIATAEESEISPS